MNSDSTLGFRRFRSKLGELSRLYWFHFINSEAGVAHAKTLNQNEALVPQLTIEFPPSMFSLTASEYVAISDEIINRTRLYLLMVCSANLESYLHEVTFAYLASIGHAVNPTKLDEVGEALGNPILGFSSIPKPLAYAEKLFGVDLSPHRAEWNNFYKLRCAVAHSGGVMTARSKKELSSMKNIQLHGHIGISWGELSKAFKSADKIVAIIDEKLRGKEIKLAEILRELTFLKGENNFPNEADVWEFLHENYGLTNIKQPFRKEIMLQIYGKLI